MAVMGYNPNESRDYHGRWGSGGPGGKSSGGSTLTKEERVLQMLRAKPKSTSAGSGSSAPKLASDIMAKSQPPVKDKPAKTTTESQSDSSIVQAAKLAWNAEPPKRLPVPGVLTREAQKAWMVGANDGNNPWNPFVRRGMGRVLGVDAHMPEKWSTGRVPMRQQEDAWGKAFIDAIEGQKKTQPPLWRGVLGEVNVKVGEEFDLLPSSWSAHPGNAQAYGRTVFVMKDAYGVTLRESTYGLQDFEVVAGGHLKVVGIHETDVTRHYAASSETSHIRIIEVQQVERLP